MFPVLIRIGGITLYSYGILAALGLIVGFKTVTAGAKYRNLSKDFIEKSVIGLIVCGFAGARILYVLLKFDIYFSNPVSIFKIWEGGLVFSGGLIGGGLWLLYTAIRTGVSFQSTGDVLVPGLALGHAIGRIGCFFAGCCYGKPAGSCAGVVFNDPGSLAYPLGVPLIPTQLISALYMAAASFFLYRRLKNRKSKTGEVFFLYFIMYGAFRIIIEYFRGDFRGALFAGWTLTQWIAAAAVITGIWMIFIKRRSEKQSG